MRNIVPCTSHVEQIEKDEKRVHHYKATMFWTSVIAFGIATAVYATNFKHIQDKEHHAFNQLDHFGHQLFAAVALVGFSAVIGAVAGLLHYGFNALCGKKDFSDYEVNVELQNTRTKIVTREDELTGLIGDHGNASIYRVGPCELVRMVYPATPAKTIFWFSVLALAIFAIGSAINPSLFNELAGDSPLANGTFTNCTVGNQTVLNGTACVQEIGHIGAVATLAGASAFAIGGVCTLFHCCVGKTIDRRETSSVTYQQTGSIT